MNDPWLAKKIKEFWEMLITHTISPVTFGRSINFLTLLVQKYCDGFPSCEKCSRD